MSRPFEEFQDFLNLVVIQAGRECNSTRFHHKPLTGVRLMSPHQANAQQTIHRSLEGFTGPPHLLLNKAGHIIIKRKSSSHIMMLSFKAS